MRPHGDMHVCWWHQSNHLRVVQTAESALRLRNPGALLCAQRGVWCRRGMWAALIPKT